MEKNKILNNKPEFPFLITSVIKLICLLANVDGFLAHILYIPVL